MRIPFIPLLASAVFSRSTIKERLQALHTKHVADCEDGPDEDAKENDKITIANEPTFERAVPNGVKYHIQASPYTVPIIHLWGSPYEMGFAHGELMKAETTGFANDVLKYVQRIFKKRVDGDVVLGKLPEAMRQSIANQWKEETLESIFANTEDYLSDAFLEELQGLSAASGVDHEILR